jgi:threonine/homoserine/homoserine lactone efflux protein
MVSIDGFSVAMNGLWLPMIMFAFVTSITPGPVNFIAATSGVNFGFARTIPQVLGATVGFSMLLGLMGFGLAEILRHSAWLHSGLKLAGAAFLLYMAVKLFMANSAGSAEIGISNPPTFLEGLLAQWLNPKAWIVSATAVTTYAQSGDGYMWSVCGLVTVFFVVCFPSIGAWAVFGQSARQVFSSKSAVRKFNFVMGSLLVLSIAGVFV